MNLFQSFLVISESISYNKDAVLTMKTNVTRASDNEVVYNFRDVTDNEECKFSRTTMLINE